jgi:hypothetical protein
MFVRTRRTTSSSKTAIQLVEIICTGKRTWQKLVWLFRFAIDDKVFELLNKLVLGCKTLLEAKAIPKLFSRDNLMGLVEAQSNKALEDEWQSPVNL